MDPAFEHLSLLCQDILQDACPLKRLQNDIVEFLDVVVYEAQIPVKRVHEETQASAQPGSHLAPQFRNLKESVFEPPPPSGPLPDPDAALFSLELAIFKFNVSQSHAGRRFRNAVTNDASNRGLKLEVIRFDIIPQNQLRKLHPAVPGIKFAFEWQR